MPRASRFFRLPTRKRATSSMGFCVADKPILCNGLFVRAANRSMLSARCDPRRFPTTAWISSTINVRTVRSSRRPDSDVNRRYSDSGVLTRICGGLRTIAWRFEAEVSPVRSSARTSTSLAVLFSNAWRMPLSGSSKFLWISLLRAFKGDTYNTRVSSGSCSLSPSRNNSSRAAKKAASVLPDPVGAAIKV